MIDVPESYSVAVVDRATGHPVNLGDRVGVEQITYGRRLTSISDALAVFTPSRMPDLARIAAHPRRHVLAIWRGLPEPAFFGPITGVDESDDGITVRASDLLWWLGRRTLDTLTEPFDGDIAEIVEYLLAAALDNVADPIPNLRRVERVGTNLRVDLWTGKRPYVASELRRLTSTTMRVTAVGHRIFGWATTSTRGTSAVVSVDQLGIVPTASSEATNSATVVWARSGALAERWPPAGQVDQVDGLDEIVLEQRSTKDSGLLRAYAREQWTLRRWPTIGLSVGGGIVLPPAFPLDFDHLIPGVRVGTQVPSTRNLQVGGIFEMDRLDVTIGTAAGTIPRDAASGRFVSSGGAISETITAAFTPVIGEVTI